MYKTRLDVKVLCTYWLECDDDDGDDDDTIVIILVMIMFFVVSQQWKETALFFIPLLFYFPIGIDSLLWEQAKKDNPDTERYLVHI